MNNRYYDPLESLHASAFLRAAGINAYDDIPEETCYLVCIEQNAFTTQLQCTNCFHVIVAKSEDANNTNYEYCPNCKARVVYCI